LFVIWEIILRDFWALFCVVGLPEEFRDKIVTYQTFAQQVWYF